LGIAELVRFI